MTRPAIAHQFISALADGSDATLVQPGDWNASHDGFLFALKDTDEIVNNSTTLQNDNDLLLTLGINQVWKFQGIVWVASATGTPDFKSTFVVPSGATIQWVARGTSAGTFATGTIVVSGGVQIWDADTTHRAIVVEGLVRIGATAGDLQLQWAQNAATVEDTKTLTDSHLWAVRLR